VKLEPCIFFSETSPTARRYHDASHRILPNLPPHPPKPPSHSHRSPIHTLLTLVTISSTLVSPFHSITKHISRTRQWRSKSSPTFQPKTILVTGLGMSKGPTIARSFYRAGHKVIGANFEPHYIPVSGRFSRSLSGFYRVSKPKQGRGAAGKYIQDLLDFVKK